MLSPDINSSTEIRKKIKFKLNGKKKIKLNTEENAPFTLSL